VLLHWIPVIVVVFIALGTAYYGHNRGWNLHVGAKVVVARVNGEPIYESDLDRGLSGDAFDSTARDMKQDVIQRLIAQVAIRQFLVKHGVHVRGELVDEEIGRLKKNPPSMGCLCCTYTSLNAYLVAIGSTMHDLRLDTKNDIGLTDYVRRSWRRSHPDEKAVLRGTGNHSSYIRHHYVRAWQIFFNTFQQSGYDSDPPAVTREAGDLAQKAWDRLQRGESFDAVAKSVSEDMTSNHKGGSLGSIERSAYGPEVERAIANLKPGKYRKPILSSWGYHIIKWEPMRDEDIVNFYESDSVDKECKSLRSQIMHSAKIERLKLPDRSS
jgi:hypothetical protein